MTGIARADETPAARNDVDAWSERAKEAEQMMSTLTRSLLAGGAIVLCLLVARSDSAAPG